ncbi:kinesin-like protein KIF25 [Pteropus vampyrus]|uniref:Kinesin-like protein n=1 Tax=Pteropus vampyrus TaxID=132908 RepID=A0A6P6BQW3_PTEVA|nr:kinesin-like protein KIF25 [Pteropus vampyrus]
MSGRLPRAKGLLSTCARFAAVLKWHLRLREGFPQRGAEAAVGRAWAGPSLWACRPRRAVCSAGECTALIRAGLQLRAQHATAVHAASSRSHLIVTVTVTTAPSCHSSAEQPWSPTAPQEAGPPQPAAGRRRGASRRASPGSPGASPAGPAAHAEQVHAKLQLVDLAGSECAGVSGVTGSALRETSCINRSLAALADVLRALWERRGHVPYRNSKLTHVLQDALGGDAKLLVMVCVSPCLKHVAETLQSLGFGARARQVQGAGPARRSPRC